MPPELHLDYRLSGGVFMPCTLYWYFNILDLDCRVAHVAEVDLYKPAKLG